MPKQLGETSYTFSWIPVYRFKNTASDSPIELENPIGEVMVKGKTQYVIYMPPGNALVIYSVKQNTCYKVTIQDFIEQILEHEQKEQN